MEEYYIPVIISIETDNSNKEVKRIAETIYNAIGEHISNPENKTKYRQLEIEYNIYKRTKMGSVRDTHIN